MQPTQHTSPAASRTKQPYPHARHSPVPCLHTHPLCPGVAVDVHLPGQLTAVCVGGGHSVGWDEAGETGTKRRQEQHQDHGVRVARQKQPNATASSMNEAACLPEGADGGGALGCGPPQDLRHCRRGVGPRCRGGRLQALRPHRQAHHSRHLVSQVSPAALVGPLAVDGCRGGGWGGLGAGCYGTALRRDGGGASRVGTLQPGRSAQLLLPLDVLQAGARRRADEQRRSSSRTQACMCNGAVPATLPCVCTFPPAPWALAWTTAWHQSSAA